MYIYIYDIFVSEKKYESTIAKIETRITDLGLNGKIIRLSVMSSLFETIKNELKKGAKTITVVGNDSILNQAITAIAKLSPANGIYKNVPLGFIPVGKKNNSLAGFLGLAMEEDACDSLSARRIKYINLGLANNNHFLTHATIPTTGTILEIDKTYTIEISEPGEIGIVNLLKDEETSDRKNQNGVLELYIKTKTAKKYLPLIKEFGEQSVFSFKNLTILNKKFPVTLDNSQEIQSPVNISLAQEKLNIIVGKNHQF